MKTTLISVVMFGCVLAASAIDKAELESRIRTLTARFDELQRQTDKAIPADTLRKAKAVILLDRTKAGFIFAYQGGGGVALMRDPKTGDWSPAAFMGASEASLGFQVGGEQNFFVILLMNTNATRMLMESTFDFGGEARGTAGDTTAGVEGKANPPEQPILVYDIRKGLYGGAAVKSGSLSPDDKANSICYEQSVSVKDILFHKKVKPTPAATELAAKLNEYSKSAKK